MIQAQLDDGRILEFPDGTDTMVIQSAVKKLLGLNQLRQQSDINQDITMAIARGDNAARDSLIQELRDAEAVQGKNALQVLEPAATVVSGAIAEPIAGLAGIAQAINPFADKFAGAEAVKATRDALTFRPKTQIGQQGLQSVAETLQPVGDAFSAAENFLGDKALDTTGSPALAAAAKTIPTAITEAIGGLVASSGKRVAKSGAKAATSGQVRKALVESAPDLDTLRDTSRAIYREIDDLGVTLKPESFERFTQRVIRRAKKERVNPRRTPRAAGALDEFIADSQTPGNRTISDLDDLRSVASDAASSIEPADARIGMIMLDEIDDFLDGVQDSSFVGDRAAEAANVGRRYRAARNLWGRMRRSELIQDAIGRADIQATGFENGIRTQLRQIVNNRKRSRYFTAEELDAMRDVIKGTNEQNILKLVGRLGFSEGQATNILGGLGGTAILGPAAPVVGQFSRKLAQRATQKGVELSDAIIRSGRNGRRIAEAYLNTTPKARRSADELSRIFLKVDANIDDLLKESNRVVKEAAEIEKGRRAFLSGAAAAGSTASQARDN